MLLRIVFGLNRDQVIESWRSPHNEILNNFYSSPKIIRLRKSSRMASTDLVPRVGKKRNEDAALVRKLEEKIHIIMWKDSKKIVSKNLKTVECMYSSPTLGLFSSWM
jgi:hypothetical protein